VNEELVNVFDDQLELIFGPGVNGKIVKGEIPPFYVGLNIQIKYFIMPCLILVLLKT